MLVPLIGDFDAARLTLLKERVLHTAEHSRTAYVVLDVTGVLLIDSQVGQGLIQLVAALRLLGATTVLVGIRPEVAQTMVGLGIEIDQIITRSTLQSGLAYTLQRSAGPLA